MSFNRGKGNRLIMAIIGIIPARYQSKRFPGKPLAKIKGQPMIYHVYELARKANCWDKLVVATDDRRIKETVQGFSGEALMTSSKHPSGSDRIAEACSILNLDSSDIVVNIQGDEPLLHPESIRNLLDGYRKANDVDVATLAFRSSSEEELRDPNVVKIVTDQKMRALYFSRAPIPYKRDYKTGDFLFLKHLGFYTYSVAFLHLFTSLDPGNLEKIEKLEQLRILESGFSIQVIISEHDSHGVDTPRDLIHVEKMMECGFEELFDEKI